MTPQYGLSIEDIILVHRDLGCAVGLPWPVLGGGQSHCPKWHAFDILEHVRRTYLIARSLVRLGAAPESLLEAAAWHDIGKVRAPQLRHDGPKFHGHAEVGAEHLEICGGFPDEVIRAVRTHGVLRSLTDGEEADGGPLWIWLELCDELAKWTERLFPPCGSDRTRRSREALLSKIESRLVASRWILVAQEASALADVGRAL